MGVVRFPLGEGRSGRKSPERRYKWSKLLWEKVGVERIPLEEGRSGLLREGMSGWNSFGRRWEWSRSP